MAAPTSSNSTADYALRKRVLTAVFATGFAAMTYAMVWSFKFGFVFGARTSTTAAFVAAVLLAWGGGAAMASRGARHVGGPLRALAAANLVAAVMAPVGLALLVALGAAESTLFGRGPLADAAAWQPFVEFLAGLVAFGSPSAALGSTLPIAMHVLSAPQEPARARTGALYGAHALGCAAAALAVGYAGLPVLGLNAAMGLAVIFNALAFALILWAIRARTDARSSAGREAPSSVAPGARFGVGRQRHPLLDDIPRPRARWIDPVMGLAAATAGAYAVVWARLLGHVLGDDPQSQALMLGAVSVGLAIGGFAVARGPSRGSRAADLALWNQALIGVFSLLLYILLVPRLSPASGVEATVGALAVIALPAGLFFGAALPLAARIRGQSGDPVHAIGQINAWSAVGAAAGVALAGSWGLPSIGFEGLIWGAVLGNLALAAAIAAFVARPRPVPILATAGALVAVALSALPRPPQIILASDAAGLAGAEERLYAVGGSATVLLTENDGVFELRRDGRTIGTVAAKGSPPPQSGERWLSALAVAARPDAQRMLVLGLGSGVALAGAPPSIRRIDVAEPELRILEANARLSEERDSDPLADARVHVVRQDPRAALRHTGERFDIIVSQPPPPWTRSGAHLYTRDFLTQAKSNLTDDGVLVERVRADFVDGVELRRLAATLRSAFEHVRLYRPGEGLLAFIASDAPLEPELQLARSGRPITDDIMHYSRMGLNGVEDLLVALAVDEAGLADFAAGAIVGSDDNLQTALRPQSIGAGLSAAELDSLFAPYDPMLARGGWVSTQLTDRINFGFVARRLAELGRQTRAVAAAEAQREESTRLLMLGLLYERRGQRNQAETAYRSALALRPDNAQARYLLIRPHIGQLSRDLAAPDITELAASLPPSALAVIDGWRFAAEGVWESLSQLDGALARAAITDVWYADTVRLRAEWRSKVTRNIEQIAFDALRLVDRALSIEPEQNLFLLRAAIGIALEDAGIAVESSRQIVRRTRRTLEEAQATEGQIAGRELIIMRQNLNIIVNNLQGDLVATDVRRAEEVRQQANQILRFIEAVTAAEQE